ncbi:MAG: hypothetical protein AB2A00_24090 [Myxococcota bacterium]
MMFQTLLTVLVLAGAPDEAAAGLAQAEQPAPTTTEPAPAPPPPAPAPPSADPTATSPTPPPDAAPAPAPTSEAAPAPETPAPARAKAPHQRPWWSFAGILGGLTVSAVAAAVTVGGVATQALALYFWVEQTRTDGRLAERQARTERARITQWIALGLMIGGAISFFSGLIGATYALGLGNPAATRPEDV